MLIILFLGLTICILTGSDLSYDYSSLGLKLWFEKMIPSLLPFMILSGFIVRMRFTERISHVFSFVVNPLWRVRDNVIYCMFMGFLCGFPMGAKVTAELYEKQDITRKEAEYLLAFCNNIGPVYFCSFVLPLLKRELLFPYLFGMYGLPLLYSLVLRYTVCKDLNRPELNGHNPIKISQNKPECFAALEDSVGTSVKSILSLGGYMILFNLLNILPHRILGKRISILSPLLEITGGLSMLNGALPLYCFVVLQFGGLCCIAQTFSCISDTDLSLTSYVVHKVILTIITCLYYLVWSCVSPGTFLK